MAKMASERMTNLGQNHPTSGPFSPSASEQWHQLDSPLGVHRQDEVVTFAVYSRRATRILLEIYGAPLGSPAKFEYFLEKNDHDNIWRARIQGVPHGTLYGLRCWGPNWPFEPTWTRGGCSAGFIADYDRFGNRFNPNKVLFDPYARELSHDRVNKELLAAKHTIWLYATGGADYQGQPAREYDTAIWAPKGVVVFDETSVGKRPRVPQDQAVIYEAHLRGCTRHPSSADLGRILRGMDGFERVVGVPSILRGTYAGAAYLAAYLKALGFTTVEWLPVQDTENALNAKDSHFANYWGYMTLGYFAPDRRYAFDRSAGGPTREFKNMIRAFHDQGLEVYLDVVYNHTGEAGNFEKRRDTTGFVSLGGFDAAEYYMETQEGLIIEGATGCGNQLNCSSAAAQELVLDSLRYWIRTMGVDGFRFDLAPVLGRSPNAFERTAWDDQRRFFRDHPLLEAIRDLGRAEEVEMIAEAWDLWGYEVGNFPSDWGEWNGRYRDAVRRFVRGEGNTREFADMMNGDILHFNDRGGAQHSINFITAHDGFTLLDLVSYGGKRNDQPWPFGPSDGGTGENLSWDCDGNAELRRQQLRNFWTILLLSRGVPMVVAGDELARTQNGNNNPWAIDSVATWTNYRMIASATPTVLPTEAEGRYDDKFGRALGDPRRNPLFLFARYVVQLRTAWSLTVPETPPNANAEPFGHLRFTFLREDGKTPIRDGLRCVMLCVHDGASVAPSMVLFINCWSGQVCFFMPKLPPGYDWYRVVDTAAWAEPDNNFWPLESAELVSDSYWVNAHSIVVLMRRQAVEPAPGGTQPKVAI
jgi:glycogen operon protein